VEWRISADAEGETMTSALLNEIGLVADIVGVVLIWRYEFPLPVNPKHPPRFSPGVLVRDPEGMRIVRRRNLLSNAGFTLLLLGFVLQFAATALQR
jgi:hypothetical protein